MIAIEIELSSRDIHYVHNLSDCKYFNTLTVTGEKIKKISKKNKLKKCKSYKLPVSLKPDSEQVSLNSAPFV